jgi:hypothetical protein
MGYIVDLTVIHHELFLSGRDVSATMVLSVLDHHDQSGVKSRIHNDIRRFLAGTAPFTYRGNDLISGKVVDLIARYCSSPSGSDVMAPLGM